VLHTLKFFVYLNDVSVENGAFTCVPGSHRETVLLRKQHGNAVTLDNRRITRQLPLEKFAAPEPVEGEAGTLIVFDTDAWHRAGTVSSGHRLVMRGHTRTVDTGEKPQSRTPPAPPGGFGRRVLRWLGDRRR
jgi:ectoine hydroxylase-related dioxygenase (phytanoyl-CoA dioxygenase family)